MHLSFDLPVTHRDSQRIEPPHKYVFLIVAFAVACFKIFRLVYLYAVNVFVADQWDFNNGTLFQRHSILQAFRWQHGPHRQGLGAILQLLFEPLIRWNSRYEAFGIALILSCSAIAELA